MTQVVLQAQIKGKVPMKNVHVMALVAAVCSFATLATATTSPVVVTQPVIVQDGQVYLPATASESVTRVTFRMNTERAINAGRAALVDGTYYLRVEVPCNRTLKYEAFARVPGQRSEISGGVQEYRSPTCYGDSQVMRTQSESFGRSTQ